MTEIAHRVALVTGAGSGIGRAVALALAGRGTIVWLVGRTLATLEAVAAEARRLGAEAVCCPADLGRDEDVEALVATLGRDAQGLDMLVHSAAMITMGPVESAPVEELDRQYRVNLRAPYVLTQALLPLLRARRGQIVFINSSAGLTAVPQFSQYSATKAALKALADSLRAEVNASGVRVLTVYPGRTATPMGREVHELEGKAYRPDLLAQPEDVAAVVVAAMEAPPSVEVTDLVLRPARKP
jgi:short-subunit dehydrogenase